MPKQKAGRRIVLIAESKSVDKDTVAEFCENKTSLQGMVVFNSYFDTIKKTVDTIHSLGHQKYTSSSVWIAKCAGLSITEKAAMVAESFSLVFAICPDEEIDLVYQDMVNITNDVIIHQ